MKKISLTDKQTIVLKSLLIQEIDYLKEEAIPSSSGEDKNSLEDELNACEELLKQINK